MEIRLPKGQREAPGSGWQPSSLTQVSTGMLQGHELWPGTHRVRSRCTCTQSLAETQRK